MAFELDKSAKARPVPRVMVVEGFFGETAFSLPATFFFFLSVGVGFRGPMGFFSLPSEGVRTREFSFKVLGLGRRDPFGLAFSLLEVERTLTVFVFEVVVGDRVVREGKVALLFTTCSVVVDPLIGSRGTKTGVLTGESVVLRAAKD